MSVSNLKPVMKGVGLVEISVGKLADYLPEKFISQYKICGNDEIYVPISWLKNRNNKKNVFDKKFGRIFRIGFAGGKKYPAYWREDGQ